VQSRVDALHAQLDRETAQVPNLVSGKYSPADSSPNAALVRDEMAFFKKMSNPLYYLELLDTIEMHVICMCSSGVMEKDDSEIDDFLKQAWATMTTIFVERHEYFSSMTHGRRKDAVYYFLLMSKMHRSMLQTLFDCSCRGESWEIMDCGGSDVFCCEELIGGVCTYAALGHPSSLCSYNTDLVIRQTPVDVFRCRIRIDPQFAKGNSAASRYRLHSFFPLNDLSSFCRVTAVTDILRVITNVVSNYEIDQFPKGSRYLSLGWRSRTWGCNRTDILVTLVDHTGPANQQTILAAASYGENLVYLSANEKVAAARYLRPCAIRGVQSVIVCDEASAPVLMHLRSILCHSLFGPIGYLVIGGNHIRRVYPTGHVDALAQHSLFVLPPQDFMTKFIGE
jgi:hypothetical protein